MERFVELDRQGTQNRDFRCSPVTPMETLSQGGMLHRMELMCMQVQADFTRQIEELETGKTFQIGEWKRPNNTGTFFKIILKLHYFQRWRNNNGTTGWRNFRKVWCWNFG